MRFLKRTKDRTQNLGNRLTNTICPYNCLGKFILPLSFFSFICDFLNAQKHGIF